MFSHFVYCAHAQDLGGTMAKFLVNVATATLCDVQVGREEEVNTKLPRGYRIQGATINLSFGSLGYTHFLAQFCDRVSYNVFCG